MEDPMDKEGLEELAKKVMTTEVKVTEIEEMVEVKDTKFLEEE